MDPAGNASGGVSTGAGFLLVRHVVSVDLILTRQKEPFVMAMKPSKKPTPEKSQATKKPARRFKATPEGLKDR